MEKTTIKIVNELLKNVRVEMLVPTDEVLRRVRKQFSSRRLNLRKMSYSEIWMRDFGPSFVGRSQEKAVLDFGFNYWGYEKPEMPASVQHEQIDRNIAKALRLPTIKSGTVGEGGNREVNGDGVGMVVEEVELQRNQGMTREQIDTNLRKAMGVEKIIWLKKGLKEDSLFFAGPIEGDLYLPVTTGGHLDNIGRFVDKHTIVAAEVTEAEAAKSALSRENRVRLEENFRILKEARDIHGKPFKIVRMPAADLNIEMMKPGDSVYDFLADVKYSPNHIFPKGKPIRVAHAASYLNFLITNGLVLTSKLYQPGFPNALKRKDAESFKILRKLFPTRRIVALETRAINLGGGGIHCITAHEPR